MIPGNWNNVEPIKEGGRRRLPAGGYIARIKTVTKDEPRQFLKIEYDISEGEWTGYYADLNERAHFWGGTFVRSYKLSAAGFFRGFLEAVQDSNPGVKLISETGSVEEQQLVGKEIGLILGEEEYEANDGTVKTKLRVRAAVPSDRIRSGDFTVPEPKKLQRADTVEVAGVVDTTQPTPVGFDQLTEEIPF